MVSDKESNPTILSCRDTNTRTKCNSEVDPTSISIRDIKVYHQLAANTIRDNRCSNSSSSKWRGILTHSTIQVHLPNNKHSLSRDGRLWVRVTASWGRTSSSIEPLTTTSSRWASLIRCKTRIRSSDSRCRVKHPTTTYR